MISQLLHIKKIRAEKADKAVQQQEYRVTHASTTVAKSEKSAEAYRNWRENEEEQRFAKAKQSTVVLKKLEALRQEIALLRERDAELKQKVAEAKKTLEKEQRVLREKKALALAAHKTTEKFVQLDKQEQAEKKLRAQHQEELEQEEFRTVTVP
jgi:type III secretion protein O